MQAPFFQLTNVSPRRCITRYAEFAHSHLGMVVLCAGWRNSLCYSLLVLGSRVSPSLHFAARESTAVPFLVPLPPPAGPFRDSSGSSHPAPRGLRLCRQQSPLPGARARNAALPRPPRRQPSPTSGYRLQPPRLWHYGHGGGDGCAEAEQAGY